MPQPAVSDNLYVEVALPVPLQKLFTYRLPIGLGHVAKIGSRVEVSFGKRGLTGYIAGFRSEIDPASQLRDSDIKEITELLDEDPLVSDEIIELTKWAADYYATSWGEMLKASLPAGISSSNRVRPKRRKSVRLLATEIAPDLKLSDPQRRIIELLQKSGGEILFTDLLELADVAASPVNTLAKRGIVEISIREVRRDPLSKISSDSTSNVELTSAQSKALDEIVDAGKTCKYSAFLLHGVTGSGKTEVYIRAMQSALSQGRSSLMLVPEIALTPVFSKRLRAVFADEVAILHSNLSTGERYDEWRRIRNGDARVVIGTRSAVFAPLNELGLIIVDEEHDTSYRQNEMPYYHGRDVAVMRARKANAAIVLGSATPSLETFDNANSGKYRYLHLPGRIGGRPLAKAELVDMRDVFRRTGKDVVLSPRLLNAIEETHAKGEQSMILLNRRGFSSFVLCRSCGESLRCKNCDITMTYHRRDGHLVCHYCNYTVAAPTVCPFCESEFLYFVGQGTEQVEEILRKRFPDLTIARIDRDSMKRKGELAKTLNAFDRGEIDLLLGTQMIAKGHDFHNVTLVGVVSVDTGLG
ncbi:MAG: primosomal protein N', partial [Pyrinomonadaceae bacterium]